MPEPSDAIFHKILEEYSPAGATKKRQELVAKIEAITSRKLIVYTASASHPMSSIMVQDIPIFEDLLRGPSETTKGDLMINSPGGDANAADKMLMMCRSRFSEEFNVIVPNFAKSAATMVAIGADKIYMGYLSELGPVDPQVSVVLPTGQTQFVPARAYIEGLESIRDRVQSGDPPQVYLPILSQIRPELLKVCEEAIAFSEEFVKRWLSRGMLKDNPKKSQVVAAELARSKKYLSHGQVINYQEAKDALFLNVELLDCQSELWHLVWELYLRSIDHLNRTPSGAKLFETKSVSITMSLELRQQPGAARQAQQPA